MLRTMKLLLTLGLLVTLVPEQCTSQIVGIDWLADQAAAAQEDVSYKGCIESTNLFKYGAMAGNQ